MRDHLHRQLSTNLEQSLYWDRSVVKVMDDDPTILPADTPLSQTSEIVINRNNESLYDEIIVVELETNRYLGIVTVKKLQNIAQLKIRQARRANPLTGLPGNVKIQNRIQGNLDSGDKFGLVYVDLDHFKPFKDYYGFERGNQAILLLKNVLDDALQVHSSNKNFLGHVGGDDFISIIDPEFASEFCEYVIEQFDDRIR
jgi:GGDEF domain-containing protein